MTVWVGIDIGTQSVRALAVTGDGQVKGLGARKLTGHRAGPRHEQDPQAWWEAAAFACRTALKDVRPEEIGGVAVDATSGTVLLATGDGTPLTPGIMYDDTRAAGEVERVNAVGGAVWAELGYQRVQAAWALPKLVWLLRENRHTGERLRLLHQSDFVNQRLVGHAVPSDLSNALKTGAHLIDGDWPHEVMDALDVPAAVLPPLVSPGTPLGVVGPAAAGQTGLPAGTPVIAGMTDGCAAQLGAGPLKPGNWNSVLGTTLVLKGVTRDLVRDPLGALYSHRGPDGFWLPGGASSTGSGVIARDFGGRDLEELDREAAAHEPAASIAYPLVSTGERFPFVAPEASGFVLGQGEEYAAVLQGVAFVERLCFDYLDLLGAPIDGDLTLTGGATRSAYWNQLRADVLGRQVILPENAEPALGMAVLAAGGKAADMVKIKQVLEPRSIGRFDEPYLRLVDELVRQDWLPPKVAAHARERTTR